MDVDAFLRRLQLHPDYAGQLTHVHCLPAKAGRYAEPAEPLDARVQELLRARGIEQLYVHQAATLDHVRAGRDTVVVTGTASGKTLCYQLPILEEAVADPSLRALYLYPTKALAQDQLKGLLELLAANPAVADQLRPGVYDGDTPTAQRRRIRAEAQLVLSNPDMLHASILPYHAKWGRFFSGLKYVVIDEAHMYRGILGANVACVLRRLRRICRHYEADPIFLAASATVGNPGELTERLIGREVHIVDEDGAPRGPKHFALWNPAPLGHDRLARRSAADDATLLLVEAVEAGAQVLAFTRTRQAAELIHRYATEELRRRHSPSVDKVRAYRGGYLPLERREMEQGFFSGELRAVAATNALELGIDVGSLDVALLVGYPGTIASSWQQAGRSGRRHEDSLAVLLAANEPIDQYLLRHPDYFFAQSPEHAVVDPRNPYVLANHLRAAAFELPLAADDAELFGPQAGDIAEALRETEQLNVVAGRYYFAGTDYPAQQVSLRHMSDNTFSIVLRRRGVPSPQRRDEPAAGQHEVIATVDSISAPELVYPEAVYLHNGQSYLVRELDLQGKLAYVERHETNYYTQAVLESSVKILQGRDARPAVSCAEGHPGAELHLGQVEVTWQTVAFKKIKFGTRENIGQGPVDIPAQSLETTALWLVPSAELRKEMKAQGYRTSEGLTGLRNLGIVALPLVSMCDPRDISGVVDSQNTGTPTMILYDRYPGGLGYCEKGYWRFTQLLTICQQLVTECECEQGCPSCVGLPNLRPAIHADPDLSRGYPVPDKAATAALLKLLLTPQTAAGHVEDGSSAENDQAPMAAERSSALPS